MKDLTTSLYVIVLTIIVIIAVFAIIKYSKNKKTEKIKQLASAKGWEYTSIREPLSWGFRLATHRWGFESIAQSISAASDEKSSNIVHVTRWFGKNNPNEEGFVLLVGPRPKNNLSGDLNQSLIQMAVSIYLGEHVNEIREISVAMSKLCDQYLVLSNNDQLTTDLLSPPMQRALMQWLGNVLPLIKVLNNEISIKIKDVQLEKPEEIESIIFMGETLLSGFR